MNMRVDEPGSDHLTGGVDPVLAPRQPAKATGYCDPVAANTDVALEPGGPLPSTALPPSDE